MRERRVTAFPSFECYGDRRRRRRRPGRSRRLSLVGRAPLGEGTAAARSGSGQSVSGGGSGAHLLSELTTLPESIAFPPHRPVEDDLMDRRERRPVQRVLKERCSIRKSPLSAALRAATDHVRRHQAARYRGQTGRNNPQIGRISPPVRFHARLSASRQLPSALCGLTESRSATHTSTPGGAGPQPGGVSCGQTVDEQGSSAVS
jgi:hypothetical protein